MALQAKREPLSHAGADDYAVEELCRQGCQAVRKAIDVLQQGGDVGLTLGLTPQQRQYVLRELMTIMAVYDSHG